MYETMVFWGSHETLQARSRRCSATTRAIWQAADKVVYSTSLEADAQREDDVRASTPRSEPKARGRRHRLGGALAAQASRPGSWRLRSLGVRNGRFRNGTVYLRYGTSAKP